MNTTANSERLLKAGITAYKAGEYEQAIAPLSQLLHSRAYRLKAGMGLVRVYIAQENWPAAQKLCQKIGKSAKPSVQQWAQETSAKIERRAAKQSRPTAPNSALEVGSRSLSGFTPLSSESESSADSKKSPLHSSGFEPLPAPCQLQTGSARSIKPVRQTSSSPVSKKSQIEKPQPSSARSIFHYDYLNSEVDAVPAEAANDVSSAALPAVDTQWTYAGRLKQGRSLGQIKKGQLWTAQTLGAVGFYFLARFLLNGAIAITNGYLSFISDLPLLGWVRLLPIYDATWQLLGALGFVAIASPWLWDIWLRIIAERQPFSLNALRPISAESAKLISQRCRQRRWPIPKLWKLQTDVPLVFSYGWLPRNARLVISEGLLTQLKEDEIAALMAGEMAQWKSIYWPILSTCDLVLQLFHQSYWQLALWGNRQGKLLNWAAGLLATLSYSLFWLLRLPILWVARVRTYYGDRTACEYTGNPNGLIRALGKLSFGLAQSIEAQGYTPPIVESAELLLPVSPDLVRYQLYGQASLSSVFAWDRLNSVRSWMTLQDPHPPLGDRISLISAYAQHWKLAAEIVMPASQSKKARRQGLSKSDWARLRSQGMPYFGLAFGLALGVFLWGLGAIAHALKWPVLDWMHQDKGLFGCCVLLSTGIGIILRINRFFPDLSFENPLSTCWAQWLEDPELLPIDSIPINLAGTVIGRPSAANWLGQDLLLKTPDGLLKLRFFSAVGPAGNFLRLSEKPAVSPGKQVQVLGWFRRGNRPWIDIDKVRLGNGLVLQAAHPIFSLAIAILASGLGLWLLLQSG